MEPSHIKELTPDPANRRAHNPRNLGLLVEALQQVGAARSIVIDEAGTVLAGNATLEAAAEAGITRLAVVEADGETVVAVRRRGLSEAQKRALALYDNRTAELAGWNVEQLKLDAAAGLALEPFWTPQELAGLLQEPGEGGPATPPLQARFLVPPFSVLDARQGYWQDRKRAWLALGMQSEVGRAGLRGEAANTGRNSAMNRLSGRLARDLESTEPLVSIFDPVLCELAYRWFCPPGGLVLDPFAGGSVRGLLASHLGRPYVGIELRPEQVAANEAQRHLAADPAPCWLEGDARELARLWPAGEADLIFTCPPYGDLEIYSDDPRDLSTLDYPEFLEALGAILAAAAARLKEDRFACLVVGDFRGPDGNYRGFPGACVRLAEAAGLRCYNDAVLLTAIGSLPLRVGPMFTAARKLGKTHQNVLVFCKGDARRATEAIGEVEYGEPPEAAEPLGGAL